MVKSPRFEQIDQKIVNLVASYGATLLRLSLGIVFLWFGLLKFFPNTSPAEDLAGRTLNTLSAGLLDAQLGVFLVATLETLIGIGLLFKVCLRFTLLLLFLQMAGTFTPLVLFGPELFTQFPFVPTLEGQYIIKNIILISAALVLGSTVRGAAIIGDDEIREKVYSELDPQTKKSVAG